MDTEKIYNLRLKIKSLTKELDSCLMELSLLMEQEDSSDTDSFEDIMGIRGQLKCLIDRKG